MKVSVKTLKGTQFEIEVKPEDTVADVKRNIEAVQGSDVYPASQQMLIHQGKVLKDTTTLEENKVVENSFVVIMMSKTKASPSGASSAPGAATSQAQPVSASPPISSTPSTTSQTPASAVAPPQSASAPESAPAAAPTASAGLGVYGQAASNLVAGSNLEATVQQILDMGGGSWDRDTVVRALRAAFNNPERAVEYLYSGIPEQADVPPVARVPAGGQAANSAAINPPAQAAPIAAPTGGPNANPLDLFPQGLPSVGSNAGAGTLDFLRNSQQFQALRAMVQANPQILQPMLQELGKQNPQLMRLIQEHQADFLRLINEPVEGEGNLLGQLSAAMPQSVTVTPEEREAIERGIPEQADVLPVARVPAGGQAANSAAINAPTQAAPIAAPTGGPNANPLDLFPQGLPSVGSNAGAGTLDFLRNSPQPTLQESGKQNPQLMRLIQGHQADFLHPINEPVEGGEGNLLGQSSAAMPRSVTVTPEEREAIERACF